MRFLPLTLILAIVALIGGVAHLHAGTPRVEVWIVPPAQLQAFLNQQIAVTHTVPMILEPNPTETTGNYRVIVLQ